MIFLRLFYWLRKKYAFLSSGKLSTLFDFILVRKLLVFTDSFQLKSGTFDKQTWSIGDFCDSLPYILEGDEGGSPSYHV